MFSKPSASAFYSCYSGINPRHSSSANQSQKLGFTISFTNSTPLIARYRYSNKNMATTAKAHPARSRHLSQGVILFVSAVAATMAFSMYKYSFAITEPKDAKRLNGETDIQRVERRLKLHGLSFKKQISGDGNCQFRALSDQLYDTEDSHQQVRSDIVRWMRNNGQSAKLANGEVMSSFLDRDSFRSWDAYCSNMAKNGVWGDHFTLTAAAENYGARVHILSSVAGDDKAALSILEPLSKKPQKTLYLLNWHDSHFDSLQTTEKSKTEKG